jgi:hypothetical protein
VSDTQLLSELDVVIREVHALKMGGAFNILTRVRAALSSPVASAQDCPNCAYPLDGPHKGERRRKWEQATPVASAQVPREPTEVMIEAARPIMMGVRLGNISCTRGAYEAGIAMYDAALVAAIGKEPCRHDSPDDIARGLLKCSLCGMYRDSPPVGGL